MDAHSGHGRDFWSGVDAFVEGVEHADDVLEGHLLNELEGRKGG